MTTTTTWALSGKASGMSKITAERNQRILLELVAQPGNDICADCKAKAPRWASHNLGIFLCVRCASIHRKIGTHVTKVKSLTLDDWTKEQVESMKTIGNVRANEYWNPDETKNPLPTNMEDSERDSELEKYIRSKYQFQRFRPLAARAAEKLGPSQSLLSRTALPSSQSATLPPPKRSHTAPIRSEPASYAQTTPAQPPLPSAPALDARSLSSGSGFTSSGSSVGIGARRSTFNPFPSSTSTLTFSPPVSAPAPPPNQQASLTPSTFNDLVSLQTPSLSSSLPLQYSQAPYQQFQSQQVQPPMITGLSQSQTSVFPSSPFGTPGGGTTNPYTSLSIAPNATGAAFPSTSSPNPSSNYRSASLPVPGFGQSPMGTMPTGSPGSLQQPFNPAPNPFTQMQMQMQTQQYPGTPLANNNTTVGQPSPFFSPQLQQQQQQQHQPPFQSSAFQSPPAGMQPQMQSPPNVSSPYATQAQQAQQLFQGMSGGGTHNPFAHWGGS